MNYTEKKTEQFNKTKYFYLIDEDKLEIKKVENNHSRQQWEDFYYGIKLFIKLSEAKLFIKKRKPYTPEGHSLQINKLEDYKII